MALLDVLDYETGNFSQWSGVQAPTNRQPTIVADPVGGPGKVGRFELQANDSTTLGDGTSGHRSEVFKSGTGFKFREGDVRWFGFRVMLSSAFASGWGNGNQMLVQWKNDGSGGAPFELRVLDSGDGRLALTDRRVFNYTTGLKIFWATSESMAAAGMVNVWHNFEVGVRFSADGTVGSLEAYYSKGAAATVRQIMAAPRRSPAEFTRSADNFKVFTHTLKTGAESYLKQGYYTGSDYAFAGVVHHDSMWVGETRADVALGTARMATEAPVLFDGLPAAGLPGLPGVVSPWDVQQVSTPDVIARNGTPYADHGAYDAPHPVDATRRAIRLRTQEKYGYAGSDSTRAQLLGYDQFKLGQTRWIITGHFIPTDLPRVSDWLTLSSYGGAVSSGTSPMPFQISPTSGGDVLNCAHSNGQRIWSIPTPRGVEFYIARRIHFALDGKGWLEIYYAKAGAPLEQQRIGNDVLRYYFSTVTKTDTTATYDLRIQNYHDKDMSGWGDTSLYATRAKVYDGGATLKEIDPYLIGGGGAAQAPPPAVPTGLAQIGRTDGSFSAMWNSQADLRDGDTYQLWIDGTRWNPPSEKNIPGRNPITLTNGQAYSVQVSAGKTGSMSALSAAVLMTAGPTVTTVDSSPADKARRFSGTGGEKAVLSTGGFESKEPIELVGLVRVNTLADGVVVGLSDSATGGGGRRILINADGSVQFSGDVGGTPLPAGTIQAGRFYVIFATKNLEGRNDTSVGDTTTGLWVHSTPGIVRNLEPNSAVGRLVAAAASPASTSSLLAGDVAMIGVSRKITTPAERESVLVGSGTSWIVRLPRLKAIGYANDATLPAADHPQIVDFATADGVPVARVGTAALESFTGTTLLDALNAIPWSLEDVAPPAEEPPPLEPVAITDMTGPTTSPAGSQTVRWRLTGDLPDTGTYRWRATVNGVVGAWNTLTAGQEELTLHAGETGTWSVRIEGSNAANGTTPASATYTWTVLRPAPQAPVQTKAGDKSITMAWSTPTVSAGPNGEEPPAGFDTGDVWHIVRSGVTIVADLPNATREFTITTTHLPGLVNETPEPLQVSYSKPINADPSAPSSAVLMTASITNQPPLTTITSGPVDGGTTQDVTPDFAFQASKPSCTFEVRVDASGWLAIGVTTTYTTPQLNEGTHVFGVRATDLAGNIGPETLVTFTVVAADPNAVFILVPSLLKVVSQGNAGPVTRDVEVLTATGAAREYVVTETSSFIEVNKLRGITPDVLRVTFNPAGLAEGVKNAAYIDIDPVS